MRIVFQVAALAGNYSMVCFIRWVNLLFLFPFFCPFLFDSFGILKARYYPSNVFRTSSSTTY